MNGYRLSLAGINISEGLARFSGNERLYEKFLNRFPTDDNFTKLCKAIEERDAGAAFAFAHTLKGTVGNLSMKALCQDLCPLVEELRRGNLTRAEELLEPVKRDYDAIRAALPQP